MNNGKIATKTTPIFQTTTMSEFKTAKQPNYAEDDKITVKASNESKFKKFAVNTTTPTPTFSKAELAMYYHQSLGNPRKETLLKRIRKHPTQFKTFPGLTCDLVSTHLPPSEATEKGHMILTRKGLRSTRTMAKNIANARRDISIFCQQKTCAWRKKTKSTATPSLGTTTKTQSTATQLADFQWSRTPV